MKSSKKNTKSGINRILPHHRKHGITLDLQKQMIYDLKSHRIKDQIYRYFFNKVHILNNCFLIVPFSLILQPVETGEQQDYLVIREYCYIFIRPAYEVPQYQLVQLRGPVQQSANPHKCNFETFMFESVH